MNLTEEDWLKKSDFYLKLYEDYKNDIKRLIKNGQFVEAKARNINLTHNVTEFIETFSEWQRAQIREGFELLYSSESLYVCNDLIELIVEFTVQKNSS